MQGTKRIKTHSVCVLLLAAVLVFASLPGIRVNAAGYTGSGTMADPYLVQTAEQLQDMRDNLSAHYRLANTIDLSGMDFKPIGRLDAPFTGSFVCELNADMTPKYAIRNLKVEVAETPYASENKSKWEAALFGATNGATISGIYVLDAYISNQVLGDNRGAVQYGDYKPGMDEMNSAILVGQADGTTIVSCGTTGTVQTRANHCGGLVGFANNSSIENCYSTADVLSEGKWSIGGLIGTLKNTTVTSCFSTGNVSGSQGTVGGFIGSACGTITDCYATGNVSAGSKSSFVVCTGDSTLTNCFTLGGAEGSGDAGEQYFTVTNCWQVSGKVHNNSKFTEGSLDQIKAAFTNLANWDVSGSQPRLKNIGVVTDSSAYTPQTVSQVADGTTSAGNEPMAGNGTPAGNGTTTIIAGSSTSEPTATPEEVLALIEALPDPELGTVTIEDKAAIKEAWNAYESLSAGDKDSFDATAFAKLADCKYQVSLLIVGDWITAVEALPDAEELTLDDIETINELWDDYQFMEESILQSSSKYETLKAKIEAAHAYAEANANVLPGESIEVENGLTKTELILVIICLTMFGLILAFELFVIIRILIKNKSAKKEEVKYEETA